VLESEPADDGISSLTATRARHLMLGDARQALDTPHNKAFSCTSQGLSTFTPCSVSLPQFKKLAEIWQIRRWTIFQKISTVHVKISNIHPKFSEKIKIDQIQFFSTHRIFKHRSHEMNQQTKSQ
jgi:hypothetical protein